MWGDEKGYDAGVFVDVGGGLDVLTEAAAGVDEGETAAASRAAVDAESGVGMGSAGSPEAENDVEGSSASALQRAACRAIKPGNAHFDLKSWKHSTLPIGKRALDLCTFQKKCDQSCTQGSNF